jgi:iron complex outermembrane receptor protein
MILHLRGGNKMTRHPDNRGQAFRWLVLSAIALSPATALYAQESASGGDTLEEIVVTAQKRVEDIQQVPIAITAINAATLEQRGVTALSQLSNIAPNVNLDAGTPFSGSDTVLSAYIRGIGQDDFAFNLDPGVGVYVDGVYLARSVGANTSMLDVDRVEILKGPQGTLFGRNSIGGAISIVTREPGNEFAVKGEVTTGSYDRFDTKLSMDIPLIADKLLSTFSFSSEQQEGYQRRIPYVQNNPGGTGAGIPDCTTPTCPYIVDSPTSFPAAGYQSASTQGGDGKWSARTKVVLHATDDIKFTVTGDYQHVDQAGSPNTLIAVNEIPGGLSTITNACLLGAPIGQACTLPRGGLTTTPTQMPVSTPLAPGGVGLNVDGNPYNNYLPYDNRFLTGNIDTTYADGPSFSKLQNWGVGSTLDWALAGGMNFKWINAYRHLDWSTGNDLDGSPEQILTTSFNMVQNQTSEEFQLNGVTLNDRLTYSAGAYYFQEKGFLHDFVTFPMGILMVDGPNSLKTSAEALYAHLNYKLTDRFSLTAGGRQTWEHKEFQGFQNDDNAFVYKINNCFPPTLPNTLGAPAFLNCQQTLGFPDAAQPYMFYPQAPGGHFTQNFNNFSPTFGADFHFTPDMMVYASYSQGFKTGSWTTRLSSPNPTYSSNLHFNPEFARSEEVGFKSELADHHVRLNLAAFHTKYDNIQLNSQIGISPTVVNAGDATIYGGELELQALLGGGFQVNASAGYTHAQYDTLNDVTDNGYLLTLHSCPENTPKAPLPATIPGGSSAAAALALQEPVAAAFQNGPCQLPKTPKFKANVGPEYLMHLPNSSELQFNADWTYVTKEYNDIGNTWQFARPAMSLVNASATYRASNDFWELTVGGVNITDKRYIVFAQNQGGLANLYGTYDAPAEWYATVRFHPSFGGAGR